MAHHPDVWRRLADAEVRATLQAMPAELRDRVGQLPILFEDRPGAALLDDGFPDDLLGLFEGPAYGESVDLVNPVCSAIRLFIENLREESGEDPEAFRQEVRTTLLHEIGHYLGLDEESLTRRELD